MEDNSGSGHKYVENMYFRYPIKDMRSDNKRTCNNDTESGYKYAKNACVRCSLRHIKCDDKKVCDNCATIGAYKCIRDRSLKKKVAKEERRRLTRRLLSRYCHTN